MIPRDAAAFTVQLALKLPSAPIQTHLLGLFRNNRPISPRRVRFSLHRSVYTRGGEIKPRTTSVLVRQCDLDVGLCGPGAASVRDASLVNEALGLPHLNVALSFDLQSDGIYSKDASRPVVPFKTLTPSF